MYSLDDDTGLPVVYPTHIVLGGNCYFLDHVCPTGAPFLMGLPVLDDGTVGWDEEPCEIDQDCCLGYEEILVCLVVLERLKARLEN